MSGGAAELFDLLRGDCHSHSDWSDGGSPIREMAEAARDLGHRYWALTDHSPRLTVAHGLDAERLRRQLDVVAELNEELAPFRILTGIEVDILEDGALDQDEVLLGPARRGRGQRALQAPDGGAGDDQADAAGRGEPPHRHPRALHGPDPGRQGPAAVDVRRGGGLRGLCAGPVPPSRSIPGRSDSTRPSRCSPSPSSLGCVVVVDTDAHAPGQLEWQRHGCEQAARVGVPADRVMNTLPMDDFLAWTAGHDG